jgi:hypothetical protein
VGGRGSSTVGVGGSSVAGGGGAGSPVVAGGWGSVVGGVSLVLLGGFMLLGDGAYVGGWFVALRRGLFLCRRVECWASCGGGRA